MPLDLDWEVLGDPRKYSIEAKNRVSNIKCYEKKEGRWYVAFFKELTYIEGADACEVVRLM